MQLKLTKKQIQIIKYVEQEHLPNLIISETSRALNLEDSLLESLEDRLTRMANLNSAIARILTKIVTKKSLPVLGGAHNPPTQIRPLPASPLTTPLPVSGGGYTLFKWTSSKYKNPEAIHKILADLGLEIEDDWITCATDLLPIVADQLNRILINNLDTFFDELDLIKECEPQN